MVKYKEEDGKLRKKKKELVGDGRRLFRPSKGERASRNPTLAGVLVNCCLQPLCSALTNERTATEATLAIYSTTATIITSISNYRKWKQKQTS